MVSKIRVDARLIAGKTLHSQFDGEFLTAWLRPSSGELVSDFGSVSSLGVFAAMSTVTAFRLTL